MIKSNSTIEVTYNSTSYNVTPIYLTENYVVSHDVSELLMNIKSGSSDLCDTYDLVSGSADKVTILGNNDIVTVLIEDKITTDVIIKFDTGTLTISKSTLTDEKVLTVISLCYNLSVPYDEGLTKRFYNLLTSKS